MAIKTDYPTFLKHVREFNLFLTRRKDNMYTECQIAPGSAQDTKITALQAALDAITPPDFPQYNEGP